MRILFTALVLIIANYATAQQVNPVPDYVFANRMSVGRNAVTDTAAYFSIGPRYGANKGFMPPIVGDTAHVTASNKRNGLLIFSVQKNKFLYWDSVRVQWSDMAGSSGSYIVAGDTASMLAPYLKETDTVWLSNRINLKVNISDTSTMLSPYPRGSGTVNYMPIFNSTRSLTNSKIYSSGTSYFLDDTTTTGAGINFFVRNTKAGGSLNYATLHVRANNDTVRGSIFSDGIGVQLPNRGMSIGTTSNHQLAFRTNDVTKMTLTTGGVLLLGTTSATTPQAGFDLLYKASGGTSSLSTMTHYLEGTNGAAVELMFSSGDGSNNRRAAMRFYSNQISSTSAQWTVGASLTQSNGDDKFYFYNASGSSILTLGQSELYVNTTNDAGAYSLQVSGAIYNTTTITTGAPTSGTAKPWRLGEVATVSPTSPNRTIRVEIDGTVYYIHAKTTND
jgi:hypothetical protein